MDNTTNKIIIGLTGFSHVGKDEAAKTLVVAGFQRIAFADRVREGLYALNPVVFVPSEFITDHREEIFNHPRFRTERRDFLLNGAYIRLQPLVDVFGWDEAKKIPEVRSLLQRFGTEAGRDIHGNLVWINLGMKEADKYERVVFTDVRFENEAEAIKNAGGSIFRITRKGVGSVNSHSSDSGLPDHLVDCEIENDHSIPELHQKVWYGIAGHVFKVSQNAVTT